VILVCAGYAAGDLPGAVELGWLAGLLALLTAYSRTLAGACGARQRFLGPMAKQHRMALLSLALAAAAALQTRQTGAALIAGALALIVLGGAVTVWRRVAAAVRELESRCD